MAGRDKSDKYYNSVVKGKVEILSGAFPDKILPDLDNADCATSIIRSGVAARF